MNSAKALYEYFESNEEEIHPAIIWDLFGELNWTKDMRENDNNTLAMFVGLYKGLYIMSVSHKEIYRCFLKNKLDDLIHTKYSVPDIIRSAYYEVFCDKKIKIGDTFIINNDKDNNNDKNEVYIYSTIQPPYHLIRPQMEVTKNSYDEKDEDTVILHKINSYKTQDKNKGRNITGDYVSVNDVKQLLFKQENKCYVCGDNVITEEWKQNCLYSFTLDRIDNSLPHNKNNVLICCYYCNCYGWLNDNSDICLYKLCPNECHKIKRNITRKRNNVSKDEIQKLILK
jgi:hypothetical protein